MFVYVYVCRFVASALHSAREARLERKVAHSVVVVASECIADNVTLLQFGFDL